MKITVGTDVKRFWNVFGDFPNGIGDVCGQVIATENGYCYTDADCKLQAMLKAGTCLVTSRKDTFENVSDDAIKLRCLTSKFYFDGGEYDIYTQ